MNRKRWKQIKEQLDKIDTDLANAHEYVARDINVEGSSFLHFGDWRGRSGHPKWMRNFMIPTLIRVREKKEKTLEQMDRKAKDKHVSKRRRHVSAR
jgi:hypothetical protein